MTSFDTGPWLMVTLNETIAPFTKGSRVALPRASAERLVEEGKARDPEAFPPQQPVELTAPDPKPALHADPEPIRETRPRPGKRYQTRVR